jgi:hypothetical protein
MAPKTRKRKSAITKKCNAAIAPENHAWLDAQAVEVDAPRGFVLDVILARSRRSKKMRAWIAEAAETLLDPR